MDSKTIRLINLETLVAQEDKASTFAEKIGMSASQLSQIRNPKYKRTVGDAAARSIETALGLPHGWMDVLHDNEASPINISALINVATPTYLNTLQQIQKAQDAGVLEESDKAMLKIIADKYKDRL